MLAKFVFTALATTLAKLKANGTLKAILTKYGFD